LKECLEYTEDLQDDADAPAVQQARDSPETFQHTSQILEITTHNSVQYSV